MAKLDYEAILQEAHCAASKAQEGMQEGTGLDCGFAWVTIDGKDPLAAYCRKQATGCRASDNIRFYGSKGYPTGWQFWKPGNYPGQSIGIHEAGAKAFRDVLSLKYQIRADVGTRYD